jgi:hypothetical protein
VSDDRKALARYEALARQWDSQFRIPGTPIRVGWDAIIGLVPGVGDLAGGAVGAIGLWTGWRLGAPLAILLQMLLNTGLDVLLGAIPIAGDLFDVGWRSNTRNAALLQRWLDRPHQTHARSRVLLVGLLAVPLLLGVAAVWLVLWLVGRMF